MEAPEKIYFSSNENGTHYYTEGIPFERDYVEYTRTDAFIEKAEKFLKSHCRRETSDGTGYICKIVDDEMIEDFKNYMEGE